MIVALLVFIALLSLAAAAFFAGAETGFLSVSRERVLHLAREGGPKAKIVQAALSDMGRTTTTLLIGNNLASVAYSSAMAALSVRFCHGSVTQAAWSFLAAFIVLYVSEFLPKLLCAARPLRRILLLAPAYRVVALILRPLTSVAVFLTDFFIPRKDSRYQLTSDDLLRILEDRKDGVCLSDIESALIGRIVSRRRTGRFITSDVLLDALR